MRRGGRYVVVNEPQAQATAPAEAPMASESMTSESMAPEAMTEESTMVEEEMPA
jgi:hypothetical protein